jgi:hypothetical protein
MLAHFPDRMHAFVWRNWHAVEPKRIAEELRTSVDNVAAVAESMGPPPAVSIPPEQKTPGYFWMTVCRRNWHIAPSEQLAGLLSTTLQFNPLGAGIGGVVVQPTADVASSKGIEREDSAVRAFGVFTVLAAVEKNSSTSKY